MPMDTATAPPRYLLPSSAYWSDEWFDEEQRRLFAHTWHVVADAAELSEPGDYVTFDAGHDPLVVVVGLDGVLRCFHNFCRHRGMTLLEGAGNTRPGISCPYHFWNFALEGDLRRVPQQEDQFCSMDRGDWGLLPGSVGIWGGLVFAHPDPDMGVDDWLGDLPASIGSHRPELLTEVARHTITAELNWKLFIENHVDVLHLWYLHSRTLGDLDHPRFEWQQLGRNWVSYEPFRSDRQDATLGRSGLPIEHLEDRDRRGIGAHAAFPNVLMVGAAEFFLVYVARPISPTRTRIELRLRGDRAMAESAEGAAAAMAAAESFILEDIAGCEGVQAAIRSTRFQVGPLAVDHERPIMLFQEHLLEAMGRSGDDAVASG